MVSLKCIDSRPIRRSPGSGLVDLVTREQSRLVRFGVLGPVLVDGVEVAAPRQRALLAMLALDAGRIVGHDQLICGLYSSPPAGAANALQSQVSRLRRTVPGLVIEHHPAGYRLVAAPAEVDVLLARTSRP